MHEGVSRRGACASKRAYLSLRDALATLDRLERRGVAREGMHIYHCKKGKCRKWHIAHKITKGRKGKR